MTLPAGVREAVEAALGPIRAIRGVGGGSISSAARLEVAEGSVFLKHDAAAPAAMFASEAAGLEVLRERAGELRVPSVIAVGGDPGAAGGWIALEWLEPGPRAPAVDERLGRGLVALHRAPADGWGWVEDGFIGSLAQDNRAAGSWAEFWWLRRLEPQLRLATARGAWPGGPVEWGRLEARLPDLLAAGEEEGPSLLHGDLWSGNVLALADGGAALVDPAAYRGHREVDLAMSELFGGFGSRYYEAYRDAWPLRPGYEECRRYVYQLYYLLVHVNLFGGSYLAQTQAALRRALAG